jgi:hypothetical protein
LTKSSPRVELHVLIPTTFVAWKKLLVCCLDFRAWQAQVWAVRDRNERFMKLLRITCFVAVSLGFLQNTSGQEFTNLNFETTTITTVVFPGGDRYTATVPGWTGFGQNFVNGDPNSVALNDIALDNPAVTLQGTNSPFAPAIQGKYSILLQGGTMYAQSTNGASIGQTGQIPLTARSITYWGNALQVTFDGQMLSFVAISNAPNYTIWGADISAYAGQTGQLLFTEPWQNEGLLDNIQFSSSPVPEPNVFGLFALGGLFFGLRRSN